MKNILIILFMLPILAMAQEKQRIEDAMKKMEELKKKMTPEQQAMMEKMGLEQTMKSAQKNMQSGVGVGIMPVADKIPDKVSTLTIPATPIDKGKLVAYLKPIFFQTENAMMPANVQSVQKLMDRGTETGKYAMVFWSHRELDKALYLLINACITNPDDYVSINNLGALLTLSGYAHKSLPLLLYIKKFVPESSTVLNNIGQAYLSLGYVEKAKPLLLSAVAKDTTKSEAYRSLALIAQKQGENALCGNYIEKAIAHGAATSENINLLKQVAPQKDISEHIRKRFKQFYKDHSVTKRFLVPSIPESYSEAVKRDREIEIYFRDFDATINATYKTQQELSKKYQGQLQDNYAKRMAQMKQTLANAGQPGSAKSMQDLRESLSNPFIVQASVMLASIDNPQFSKSYINRMKAETADRSIEEKELKLALENEFDKEINALVKEKSILKDGEGQNAANARAVEIDKKLCELRTLRQNKWLESISKINTQYIHKMENLLNQRLQEYLFWNTIVMQSIQDPTAVNYAFYVSYLKNLRDLAYPLFPTHVDGGLAKPCGDYLKRDNSIKGKIHDWERENCEVDFGIDLLVTGAKMNCEGWSVYADFKAGSFAYERNVDPVTWQTTGHSISVKGGKDKEFEIGKLKGSIGASVETTIKFDGNMNPVDITVEAAAGAELSGPMGGKLGADLGSVEISVSNGVNGSGPGFTPLGSNFLKN